MDVPESMPGGGVRPPIQASEHRWRPCFTSGRDRTGCAILLDPFPLAPGFLRVFVVVRLFGIRLVEPYVAIQVPSWYLRALCFCFRSGCSRDPSARGRGVSPE